MNRRDFLKGIGAMMAAWLLPKSKDEMVIGVDEAIGEPHDGLVTWTYPGPEPIAYWPLGAIPDPPPVPDIPIVPPSPFFIINDAGDICVSMDGGETWEPTDAMTWSEIVQLAAQKWMSEPEGSFYEIKKDGDNS